MILLLYGFQVKRILVNTGNSMEILNSQAFHQMDLKDSTLEKTISIFGFVNHPI